MKVQLTGYLREELSLLHTTPDQFLDPDQFVLEFAEWKSSGSDGEFDYFYFGKDSEYARPMINGVRVLRHVHLAPFDDTAGFAEWNRDWRKYRRRKSDTALVYADGGRHGFLLIAILWEPGAHEVAEMKTQESADAMNGFANVADQFIFDGTILI